MENGQKTEVEAEIRNNVEEVINELPTGNVEDAAEKNDVNAELIPGNVDDAEEKNEINMCPEHVNKIKGQVEYYFGDANMQRDKFLIEQVKLDEGWIPMTVMLNFKLLANLSKNIEEILKALETSDLIEISEDRKKIRRSPKYPLPEYNEEYRKAQEARTVYVKGFPLTGTTIDLLKSFFENTGAVETIIMRKYQDKDKSFKFKGSIFVQFKNFDDAEKFMNTVSIKYGNVELIRKWRTDYIAEKAQEKEERRKKKSDNKLKKFATDQKETDSETTNQTSVATDIKLPKGSIIYFCGTSKESSREDIKESFNKLKAEIAYIDFHRGSTEGWIRLQGENAAKLLLEKMEDSKITIDDTDVTCKILENEEEDRYLAKVREDMIASKNKYYNKGKRGNKKGRNAQGSRKRSHSPTCDAVSAKKTATE